MDPVTHTIIGNRAVPPSGTLDHWQAAPMRIAFSLVSGQTLAGALRIIAEIHASQTVTATPLATIEDDLADVDGPWTLEFSNAQMSQTVPESRPFRELWLTIVALYPSGRIEPLSTRTIKLHRSNYSGAEPAPPAVTQATIDSLSAEIADIDTRVADLETNGTGNGGGVADLVIRIVDATADATDTALHLAYNPLALTIPAESPAGLSGALQSHTPGTVKLVLPTGFEVYYDDLPAGTTGRPVIAFRGGRIDFLLIAPGRLIIRGDYVSTADTWHPTDESDSLLGLWQAGPDITHGGHVSFPCADTESVTFTSDLMMRWEALFGSRANARWLYDWLGNTEGGGDQGTSPGDYAPRLVADATFASGYAYILRTGAATSRICRARDADGDMILTTPCRLFIALRQISGLTQGDTTLLRVNSELAYTSLKPGGLQWRGSGNNGYQYVHANSSGSWGSKGGTFNTHENTLNAVLLTLVLDSTGGGQIYSGSMLVSGAMTGHTSITHQFLQFYTGLNAHLGGIAIIAGTSSDLTAEISAMEALLLA